MTDYALTLAPESGLARRVRMAPPDGRAHRLWTIAVDVGAGDFTGPSEGIDIGWVGAAGIRRGATLPRAAGEAVERFALQPRTPLPDGDGAPSAPAGACWREGSAVRSAGTYLAHATDGRTVAVPAGAVDYPSAGPPSDDVDPSPSGAAAGIGLTAAIASARRELLERDVALRSWYRPDYAVRVEPEPADDRSGALRTLLRAASDVELRFAALTVPDRPTAMLCLAIDDAAGVVGAGLSLEPSEQLMAVKAAQEALQIRALLTDLARHQTWQPPTLPVHDELARARLWASPGACDRARDWWRRTRHRPPEGSPGEPVPGIDPTTVTLPHAVLVDLSARLPEPVRALGWSAVKMFDPTLQPLRMSDAHEWNVADTVRRDGGDPSLPHPFI